MDRPTGGDIAATATGAIVGGASSHFAGRLQAKNFITSLQEKVHSAVVSENTSTTSAGETKAEESIAARFNAAADAVKEKIENVGTFEKIGLRAALRPKTTIAAGAVVGAGLAIGAKRFANRLSHSDRLQASDSSPSDVGR